MKETIRLAVILLLICVVSAGVLAISNNLTKEQIAKIEMEESLGAIAEIFSTGDDFVYLDEGEFQAIQDANPNLIEILEVYEGGELTGYSIKNKTSGFDGDIVMVTGFSTDGEVVGMRLLEHTETPGLGSRAADEPYTSLYVGLPASEELNVDSLSGATVTSNAVLAGANYAREIYVNNFSN